MDNVVGLDRKITEYFPVFPLPRKTWFLPIQVYIRGMKTKIQKSHYVLGEGYNSPKVKWRGVISASYNANL